MLRLLAFSIVISAAIVASAANRFAALMAYVWFALFRPQEWVYQDITGFRFSLILGALLILPTLFAGILPIVTHPLSFGSLVVLVSALVAQTTTFVEGDGWSWLDQFARLVVVGCFAIALLTTRYRLVLFIALVAASLGAHSAKAGVAFLLGGGGTFFVEGIGGAYADNNAYAIVGCMVIPFMAATYQNFKLGWRYERWIRLGFLAAIPLSVLMVIGTRSRSGFLSFVVICLFYLALQRYRVRKILAASVVAAVVLLTVPLSDQYVDRLRTITTYEEVQDGSALGRLHFWQVAMTMANENPLGVGPYNFERAYNLYDTSLGQHGTNRSVHNSHLQVLTEFGLVGFIGWVGLFAWAFFVALRLRRRSVTIPGLSDEDRVFYRTTAEAMLATMAAFLVGGTFISMAMNDLTWYTFAILAAVDRLSSRAMAAASPAEIPESMISHFQAKTAPLPSRAAGFTTQ